MTYSTKINTVHYQ